MEESVPIIEFRGVSYRVPAREGGSRPILDDVSISIAEGSVTCIMGVSGSGKTTLLRLMAGLIRADEGQILLFGRDITEMRERELNEIRSDLGFVFQYSALFDSLSVGENIGFSLRRKKHSAQEIEKRVAKLLDDVGLPGFETRRPSQLSGGQKKRVAMARALADQPKIVLYDEPDSGLDPVMTSIIDDLILATRSEHQTTNIVVSHNVASIFRIADRVIMLHEGQIVADDTPVALQASQDPMLRQFIDGKAHGPLHR